MPAGRILVSHRTAIVIALGAAAAGALLAGAARAQSPGGIAGIVAVVIVILSAAGVEAKGVSFERAAAELEAGRSVRPAA